MAAAVLYSADAEHLMDTGSSRDRAGSGVTLFDDWAAPVEVTLPEGKAHNLKETGISGTLLSAWHAVGSQPLTVGLMPP